MIVFGVPKLFCAASQVAVALSVISVVTKAMRIKVVIERTPPAKQGRRGGRPQLKYYPESCGSWSPDDSQAFLPSARFHAALQRPYTAPRKLSRGVTDAATRHDIQR